MTIVWIGVFSAACHLRGVEAPVSHIVITFQIPNSIKIMRLQSERFLSQLGSRAGAPHAVNPAFEVVQMLSREQEEEESRI